MNREFYWKCVDTNEYILCGPKRGTESVKVVLAGDGEDTRWKIRSEKYKNLNFDEMNASIPAEKIQRRVLILLGSELERRKKVIESDMENVIALLFEEAGNEADDEE